MKNGDTHWVGTDLSERFKVHQKIGNFQSIHKIKIDCLDINKA